MKDFLTGLIGQIGYMKLLAVFLIWNLAVFLLYGADKLKAKRGAWRISEKALLLCGFLLGGPGAFAGMKVFRHKTQHTSFRILVPVFAVLSLVFMGWLYFLSR